MTRITRGVLALITRRSLFVSSRRRERLIARHTMEMPKRQLVHHEDIAASASALKAVFGRPFIVTCSIERKEDGLPAQSAAQGDLQHFAVPLVLPNGTSILIRAVRPDDKERFRTAFGNLERRSIYARFFGYKRDLTEAELQQATNVDFDDVVAIVATVGSGESETIIAGARYARGTGPASRPSAELAFLVEEDYQGQGIAGSLLGHLVRIARSRGVSQFDADVLAANRPMLAVFARSRLPMRQQRTQDLVRITLSLQLDQADAFFPQQGALPP